MDWAIVEVMGHRRYAGRLEEVVVAGAPLLRVHVPAMERERIETEWRAAANGDERWARRVRDLYGAWSVDLGGSSIFAVTRCSEERACAAAPSCHLGPEPPVVEILDDWYPVAPRPLVIGWDEHDRPFDATPIEPIVVEE